MKYARKSGVAKKATRKPKTVMGRINKFTGDRYGRGGNISISKIVKDVMMLKSLVNVEKKTQTYTYPTNQASVARLNGTGNSGGFYTTIDPNVTEGVTATQRNGDSYKLISACADMEFRQQDNCINEIRYKWYIVRVPQNSANESDVTLFNKFFITNPFTGVRDFHSSRDPQYFSSFKIVKSGKGLLIQNSLTGEKSQNQIKIPLKLGFHQKFATDVSVTPTINSFKLFVVGDTGDKGVPLTGVYMNFTIKYFFTDN